MSLDVYLTAAPSASPKKGSGIFIRRDGATVEVTREEYEQLYPGREPIVINEDDGSEVFHANITHNLNVMAEAAGIYNELWRPEEVGIKFAWQLLDPLRAGLERLRADSATFEALNPANGWGSYEQFVPWVERYLKACEDYPTALVGVWR